MSVHHHARRFSQFAGTAARPANPLFQAGSSGGYLRCHLPLAWHAWQAWAARMAPPSSSTLPWSGGWRGVPDKQGDGASVIHQSTLVPAPPLAKQFQPSTASVVARCRESHHPLAAQLDPPTPRPCIQSIDQAAPLQPSINFLSCPLLATRLGEDCLE